MLSLWAGGWYPFPRSPFLDHSFSFPFLDAVYLLFGHITLSEIIIILLGIIHIRRSLRCLCMCGPSQVVLRASVCVWQPPAWRPCDGTAACGTVILKEACSSTGIRRHLNNYNSSSLSLPCVFWWSLLKTRTWTRLKKRERVHDQCEKARLQMCDINIIQFVPLAWALLTIGERNHHGMVVKCGHSAN